MASDRAGTLGVLVRSIATQVAVLGFGMLSAVLVARWLGPAERGELEVILIGGSLVGSLASLGLPPAVIFHSRRRPELSRGFVRAALLLGAGYSAILGIIAAACLPWLTQDFDSQTLKIAQLATIFLAPVSTTLGIVIGCAQIHTDFRISNRIRFAHAIGFLAAIVLVGLSGTLTPALAASIQFIVTGAAAMVGSAILLRSLAPSPLSVGDAIGLLKFGLPLYGVDVIGTLSTTVDRVFVIGLVTPALVGIYAVIATLARLLRDAQGTVAAIVFSRVAGLSFDNVMKGVGRAFRFSVAGNLLVLAMSIPLASILIAAMYGPAYRGSELLLVIFLVEVSTSSVAWLLAQGFLALGRTNFILFRQIVSLVGTLLLLAWLAPAQGIEGAALALLAGAGIRLVITLVAYPILLNCRAPMPWPTREDAAYLMASLRHFNQKRRHSRDS